MNYDIVAGADQPTLNTIVSQVYTAVYPSLFRNTISVNKMGIESVTIDINAAPTLNLNPSEQGGNYFKDKFENGEFASISEDAKTKLLELATAATLELDNSSIVLTVNYSDGNNPITVQSSMVASANIQTSTTGGNNFLTIDMLTATITIPGEPVLEDLLNNIFIPFLINYLNENILSAIQIPVLQYNSLQVSLPVPVVQPGQPAYLTAYSALGATQPDIPAPYQFPTNCIFIGIDNAFLTAAIDAGISFPLGPAASFSWKCIDGGAGAQILAPSITINNDGSIKAVATANAYANLTLHTPDHLPNVSFGPTASATLTLSFAPLVEDGQLFIKIVDCLIPTFSFSWGIPSWISWFFDPLIAGLTAALNALLAPLIRAIFDKVAPIRVWALPEISFTLAGNQINISIDQATTSNQDALLMVSAQATVS